MNCGSCNIQVKKCKSAECNNYVKRCSNCWYDFDKKCIDKLPFTLYIPLSQQEKISNEYLSKQLEAIACGKCDYITKLFLMYGKDIPLVALQFEDIKINIEFDKNLISNKK
jgi:hypothetical protein